MRCVTRLRTALLLGGLSVFSAAGFAGQACAIHLEGDFNIASRLNALGCQKGDPVLFYNAASTGKWEILLPIRIAVIAACDMSMPITDSGITNGYQFTMCTYSGSVRELKGEAKHMKGWGGLVAD